MGTWNSLIGKEEHHLKGWSQSFLWAGAHVEPFMVAPFVEELERKCSVVVKMCKGKCEMMKNDLETALRYADAYNKK